MTSRPVIWFPRKLSEATLARARSTYDVIVNEADTPGTAEEIIAMSAQVDAMVPCHSEQFSADVVAALDPRLKIVANHSVGVDHCDLPALKARGITVTNTPDVLSDATAEIAMLLMLGAARRAVEGDALVRDGKWSDWSPAFMVGKQVSGARLGIIGMGRVGRAFAEKARGFGMDIHYHNRTRLVEADEHGATYHPTLETLLPEVDFISLHCPATPETTDLINTTTLSKILYFSFLLNTARGALVDEDALIAALSSGKIREEGID